MENQAEGRRNSSALRQFRTFPRKSFYDVHGVTVDCAILAEPRVIDEIYYVDDHRVPFLMPD
jgi:hypothetical protein